MSDFLSPQPAPEEAPAPKEDAARQLRRLWRTGQRPDVDAFLVQMGSLPPSEVVAVLRVDQDERWRIGERVKSERYLHSYRRLWAQSSSHALDLIFNEFLIRERLGEQPSLEDFCRRFPPHADQFKARLELHRASVASTESATLLAPGGIAAGSAARPLGSRRVIRGEFGRYRIVKELGKGGMGTVYLARDSQLDRLVALKVPHFGGGNEAGMLQRFYREARIAATFLHPNLCPIYDVGEIEGIHYLTMPYLQGEPLSAWLEREGRLPQRTAARLVYLVARAMGVAHRAGVIHRDLKPANIMLTEHRAPVVMDFGLARRSLALDPRMTPHGVVLGTGAYSSPEQIKGPSEGVGPATDIYSLGVLLYELLTGQLPFRGPIGEVMQQTLNCEPPPPSLLLSGLDPGLEAICLQAMAKEPRQRFASMDDFALALADYFRGSWPVVDVTAEADGPPLDFLDDSTLQPARQRPRSAEPSRRRLRLLGVALATLAIVGLLVIVWLRR
jgi:hypothetical protein